MEYFNEEVQKILLSALLGGIIGLEREWSGKSAGFRTLILVNMGATIFTIVSYKMGGFGESDRIAANIVTGIGFLGAGLIFRNAKGARGLTTAASVWASAAIGMLVGVGDYVLAISATVITWVVLVVFFRIQLIFDAMMETREYRIVYKPAAKNSFSYDMFFDIKKHRVLENKQLKDGGHTVYVWTIRAPRSKHLAAIAAMLEDENVIDLEY